MTGIGAGAGFGSGGAGFVSIITTSGDGDLGFGAGRIGFLIGFLTGSSTKFKFNIHSLFFKDIFIYFYLPINLGQSIEILKALLFSAISAYLI